MTNDKKRAIDRPCWKKYEINEERLKETHSSCKEKASAVGGGIIGQPNVDPVLRQLMTVGSRNHTVALKPEIVTFEVIP